MADAARKGLSTVKKVLFSVLPILMTLGVLEGMARTLWEPENLGMYDGLGLGESASEDDNQGTNMIAHPTRIWTLEEGEHESFQTRFSVSEYGMRKVEVSGSDFRILTTGDSSVFGHGVEDDGTLHHFIKSALWTRRVSVDVFTGAVPGYSSEQTLDMLNDVGWALEPDLLVVGNLWSDNGIKHWSDREWMQSMRSTKNVMAWFLNGSQAWRWMRWKLEPPGKVELPVTWVRDPYATGRRRVPVSQYAQNLDLILRQAIERNTGVLFLSPCNRLEGILEEKVETSWSSYFDAMEHIVAYRNVLLVRGCDVVKASGQSVETLFIDDMHPSSVLNEAYGNAIALALANAGWPKNRLVPDAGPPLFDEVLEDGWDAEVMRAKSIFDDCNETSPLSCFEFGLKFEYGKEGFPTNLERAHTYYEQACDFGAEAGCKALELAPEEMLKWRSQQSNSQNRR